ncbi:multidrug transporter AcrB [Sesbania bispinosa]|nr:multidrug transporter AcrB [Sesbania bispinosa]
MYRDMEGGYGGEPLLVVALQHAGHGDGVELTRQCHREVAARERQLVRWRWYGWWQHRSGRGKEEDAPVCATATIVARLECYKVYVVRPA